MELMLAIFTYPLQEFDGFCAGMLPVNGKMEIFNRDVLYFTRILRFEFFNNVIDIMKYFFVITDLFVSVQIDGQYNQAFNRFSGLFVIYQWHRQICDSGGVAKHGFK